jgi:hypothetical protein
MATENENVPPVSPAVSPGEVDKNASPDAVPPGVEAGGIWGVNHYRGPTTGTATLVGFLCFCIPGLLMLIFALDNREAYKVNGKVRSLACTILLLCLYHHMFSLSHAPHSPLKLPVDLFPRRYVAR